MAVPCTATGLPNKCTGVANILRPGGHLTPRNSRYFVVIRDPSHFAVSCWDRKLWTPNIIGIRPQAGIDGRDSLNPALKPQDIYDILKRTADPIPDQKSMGLINAQKAVAAAQQYRSPGGQAR